MKDKSVSNKDLPKMSLEEVSERGSLGLLALGAAGLVAWRQKRAEAEKEKRSRKTK